MTEIWWVEDFLSGEVLENRYYSDREEAASARNRLGYGLVKSTITGNRVGSRIARDPDPGGVDDDSDRVLRGSESVKPTL